MNKRCIGCGALLQSDDATKVGYTPKVEKDYCMRCFRLTHYNDLTESHVNKDNDRLISIVNQKKQMVFFLCDLWNLNEEVMRVYHQIHTKKALLLTKWDTVPKGILEDAVLDYIVTYYQVKDPITTISSKNKRNSQVVLKYMESHGIASAYLLGFTNVGKSTFVNQMSGRNAITVSRMPNTTLDFINVYLDALTLTDAPGFTYQMDYQNNEKKRIETSIPNEEVKPRIYQVKKDTLFLMGDMAFTVRGASNVSCYVSNALPIERKYKPMTGKSVSITVPGNSDLVIRSVGFIRFIQPCVVEMEEAYAPLCEVRPSILGGIYE